MAAVVVTAVLAAMAIGLRASQAGSRRLIEERFALRAVQAARFVSTYSDDLLDREEQAAARHLGQSTGDGDEFGHITETFGFTAAVMTDSDGRLLAVAPHRPDLLGRDMRDYAHLRAAAEGTRAISNVVPSAADHVPVVAFATPFSTDAGRFVFSGAYAVHDTPIAAFLRDLSTVAGFRVYLVDAADTIAASHPVGPVGVRTLTQRDVRLADALAHADQGRYEGDVDRWFATAPVRGTPWRIVTSVPTDGLYASVRGPSQWAPWLLLGVLALLAYAALVVSLRYVAGRRLLAVLSDTDPLTHVPNRRSMERHLAAFGARARRHVRPWSVLMVDLDHFKRVNDTFGHPAGDHVLEVVAARMHSALRLGDELGRWGGEEFIVVLDDAGEADAVRVAERLRAACTDPIELSDGRQATVRLSVGCASTVNGQPDELVAAADAALYAAKSGGRDRVVSAAGLQVV